MSKPLSLSPESVDVAILCGGKGTRLRDVISDKPKPLAEVMGKPFLDIQLAYISSFGFNRFLLCAGYMGDAIKKHYAQGNDLDISVIIEEKPLGTGGAIKHAEAHIVSKTFLVLNGDSLAGIDLGAFLNFHQEQGGKASIALVPPRSEMDFGAVDVDKNGMVTGFAEKSAEGAYINSGVYLFEKSLLTDMPEGVVTSQGAFSLETGLFPRMLDGRLRGYVSDGKLIDIGTPERLTEAQDNGLLQSIIASM